MGRWSMDLWVCGSIVGCYVCDCGWCCVAEWLRLRQWLRTVIAAAAAAVAAAKDVAVEFKLVEGRSGFENRNGECADGLENGVWSGVWSVECGILTMVYELLTMDYGV